MIMEWKRQANGTLVASWRGQHLVLVEHPNTKRWQLHIVGEGLEEVRPNSTPRKLRSGCVVSQTWPSAKKAMNDIELRQQRIILEAAQSLREVSYAQQ